MKTLEPLIAEHPFMTGLNPHFLHLFNECATFERYGPGQEILKAEENPAFGYDLAMRVAKVLLQRLQATRRQLLDFYADKR